MKSSFRIFTVLFFLLITTNFINAQGKVIVRLIQPPPNRLGAADLWKLDISNTTNEDIAIYLKGTASEEKDGLIVEGQSKVFTVKPGKKTYGYNDFKSGNVNWKNKTYEEAIIRTGNVKSGNYDICVTAFYEDGRIADNEQCITQNIEQISENEIILVSPSNGEEVNSESGISFVWTGQGIKGPYTLTIKEVRNGQTNEQAMKENLNFFKKENISTTTYQYPASEKKFEVGKKYAWNVKSRDAVSEVWEFELINFLIPHLDPCFGKPQAPSNMVGWWTMDETSGAIAHDIISGMNGSIPIDVTHYASGKVSRCLMYTPYNSSFPLQGTVLVPDNPILNFGKTTDFTIDAWVGYEISENKSPKSGSIPNCVIGIFEKQYHYPSSAYIGYSFGINLGKLYLELSDQSGGYAYFYTENEITTGTDGWVHLAVSVKRNTGVTFFENGNPMLSFGSNIGNPTSSINLDNNDDAKIGWSKTCSSILLDEVEVYNRALTQAEISQIAIQGKCKFTQISVNPDTIKLPVESCDCGHWQDNIIDLGDTSTIDCGSLTNINTPKEMNFLFPNYLCSKPECSVSYKWKVTGPQGNSDGNGKNITYTFSSIGNYKITVYAYCGHKLCDSCYVNVHTNNECNCGIWNGNEVEITPTGGHTKNLKCGEQFNIYNNQEISFNFPTYICSGTGCIASYTWAISGPGSLYLDGGGKNFTYNFSTPGTYYVKVYTACAKGGKICDSCQIIVNYSGCNCGKWMDNRVKVSEDGNSASLNCGDSYNISTLPKTINFSFPSYYCPSTNSNCYVSYKWSVTPGGPYNGTGNSFSHTFINAGVYVVKVLAYCGEKLCDSCSLSIDSSPKTDTCQLSASLESVLCGPMVTFGNTQVRSYTFNISLFSNINGWFQTSFPPYQWNSNSGNNVSAGQNTFHCTFINTLNLQPGAQVCIKGGVMRSASPFDTCFFNVCFNLPSCADTSCSCGPWNQVTLQQGSINETAPVVNKQAVFTQIFFNPSLPITVIPSFTCSLSNCTATFEWRAWNNLNAGNYQPEPIVNTFNASGLMGFTIKPTCSNTECDTVHVLLITK